MKPLSMRLDAPKSLANQVASKLRQSIVDGTFKLGEMIPEEALAAAFGVSRTPVREALNQLQVEGLVTVRPQRGSYVFEPEVADLEALCEFRCLIEPRAAQLAWAHDRAAVLEKLEQAVAEMEAARSTQDALRCSAADTFFHEAIVQHCGNRYLQASYTLAGARIAALRTQMPSVDHVVSQEGIDHHRRLTELLRAADWPGFDALMREHVMDACRFYRELIRARRAQRPA